MTKPSLNRPSFLLRLLGPPRIEGLGAVLTGPPAHRHRLALLALLATSPRHVLARDRIIGILWPEAETTTARQLLSVGVHELRRALGEDVLHSEGGSLRLDTRTIRVDTVEFEAALGGGDAASAVELYSGVFLDGFALPGAVEFDHWADGERDRLERRYQATLEQLADGAGAAGHEGEAVSWWRRRLARTPSDGHVVLRLMEALARAGDRAGALNVARSHADLLREEYDAEPDTRIVSLAAQLRRTDLYDGEQTVGPFSLPGTPVELPDVPTPPEARRTPAAVQSLDSSAWRGGPTRSVVRHATTVLLIALAGFAAVEWSQSGEWVADRVAVAPFQNHTGDTALATLGHVTAHWITDGLQRTLPLEVVPTPTAAHAWRTAQGEVAARRARDPLRAFGADTRAAIVISGNYFRSGDTITFQAQISDARSGRLLSPSVMAASAVPQETLDVLRERILGSLAAAIGQERVPLTVAETKPPTYAAYQNFLAAMEQHDQLEWGPALELFYEAGASDSTFLIPLLIAGAIHAVQGRYAQADSLATVVEMRETRLNPVELQNLHFLRALTRRDWLDAYRASSELYRLGAERWAFNAASAAFYLNRPREGIEWLEKLDPERGAMRAWSPYWNELTLMHHALGQHGRELRAVGRARRQYPDLRWILRAEVRARAARGEYQRVLRLLDESQLLRAYPGESYLSLVETAALEFSAHGYARYRQDVLEQAVDRYDGGTQVLSPAFGDTFDLARVLYHTGRPADAREIIASLARTDSGNVIFNGYLGIIAARSGEIAEADRFSDRLARLDRPYLFGSNSLWRARIAAARGETDPVIRLLAASIEQGWVVAPSFTMHTDELFRPLWNHPSFQELVRPKG